MQEAKDMKLSILCTLCLIKVLNVANMASGRQAWRRLYTCTYVATDLALARSTVSGTSSMGKQALNQASQS